MRVQIYSQVNELCSLLCINFRLAPRVEIFKTEWVFNFEKTFSGQPAAKHETLAEHLSRAKFAQRKLAQRRQEWQLSRSRSLTYYCSHQLVAIHWSPLVAAAPAVIARPTSGLGEAVSPRSGQPGEQASARARRQANWTERGPQR